jgi:hypothetical protein
MAQTAAQTQAEIVQLRRDMSSSIDNLRAAARRPARAAKAAAGITAVVAVGAVGVALYLRQKRLAEQKTIKGRARQAMAGLAQADKALEHGREAARARLLDELGIKVPTARPFHEEILHAAADSAVKTAVPVIVGVLVHRLTTPRPNPDNRK